MIDIHKQEIRKAVTEIFNSVAESEKRKVITLARREYEYEVSEEELLDDLTVYLTDFVKCEVSESGSIIIDKDDALYDDFDGEITTLWQLINLIG